MDNLERDLIAQLDVEVEKGMRAAVRAIKKGLRFLVEISPVDTGWYRYNHRVSINGAGVPLDPPFRPRGSTIDFSPLAIVQREASNLDQAKLGDTITIINAVPYAELIELQGTPTTPDGNYYGFTEQYVGALLGRKLNTSFGTDDEED